MLRATTYNGGTMTALAARSNRRLSIVGAAVGILLLISACVGAPQSSAPGISDAAETPAATRTPAESARPESKPKSENNKPERNRLTVSQQNAIESAESYLRFSAFSRSGLINQLEYEGFSNSDATFAVDSLSVDWKEQAAKSAENYLEYSSFSLSGLIDQLVFEGFTRSQAEYGAGAAFSDQGGTDSGGGTSVSRQNAIETTRNYLNVSAFSRSGLINQLEFEGYSTSDATYAVDTLSINWNEQAAKSAANYLRVSSFSRSGLIDQLIFEGFTRSQAEYGVSQTGL